MKTVAFIFWPLVYSLTLAQSQVQTATSTSTMVISANQAVDVGGDLQEFFTGERTVDQ